MITNLPEGWETAKLADLVLKPKSDIVDGPFGSNLKASEYTNEGIPIIRLQNINRFTFINKNIQYISEEKAKELSRHNFNNGDIVITKLGDPLGKACFIPNDMKYGIIVADVVRLRIAHNFLSHKFVIYVINSDYSSNQLKKLTKGTTRPRVNLGHIRDLLLPIPPLQEQNRIVTKIEELFTKLDAGVEALKQVQAQLKHYGQSVLKAAVEGRLTAEWREQHKEKLEPAEKLLERTLIAHREKWEAEQLAKYKPKDKKPPRNWKEKYKVRLTPFSALLLRKWKKQFSFIRPPKRDPLIGFF